MFLYKSDSHDSRPRIVEISPDLHVGSEGLTILLSNEQNDLVISDRFPKCECCDCMMMTPPAWAS